MGVTAECGDASEEGMTFFLGGTRWVQNRRQSLPLTMPIFDPAWGCSSGNGVVPWNARTTRSLQKPSADENVTERLQQALLR